MGLAMCWGGDERFGGPSFATARIIPGGASTWGLSLAIIGALVMVGSVGWQHPLLAAGSLGALSLWFGFFAYALAQATLQQENAAVTGPFAYTMLAALSLFLAVGRRGMRA